eukprot:3592478-Prymnesium_polylepis.1
MLAATLFAPLGAPMGQPEPAPAVCRQGLGLKLETRASWSNGGGAGFDMTLHLKSWADGARVRMRFPRNMGFGAKPVVHAVEWDMHQSQPPNLISTRNEIGLGEKLALANCEETCTGAEAPDVGSIFLDLSEFMLDDVAEFT